MDADGTVKTVTVRATDPAGIPQVTDSGWITATRWKVDHHHHRRERTSGGDRSATR